MRKLPDRTLRIIWCVKGVEVFADVFIPIVLLNLRMVDLRLRKAHLTEITPLTRDSTVWYPVKQVKLVFTNTYTYFCDNPDSIPFSDILESYLPRVLEVFEQIPVRTRVRFETNDLLEE